MAIDAFIRQSGVRCPAYRWSGLLGRCCPRAGRAGLSRNDRLFPSAEDVAAFVWRGCPDVVASIRHGNKSETEGMAEKIDALDDAIFARCARRLMPFVALLYLVNYIDRVNVGFAALTMNR